MCMFFGLDQISKIFEHKVPGLHSSETGLLMYCRIEMMKNLNEF